MLSARSRQAAYRWYAGIGKKREMGRYLRGAATMDALVDQCAAHARPVTQPVGLISQAGRSGGTLLSRLFDGHPECHAHPYEFRLGGFKDFNWPGVDPGASPEDLFDRLFETVTIRLFREGYSKGGKGARFPFYLLPNVQRAVFLDRLAQSPARSSRDVFDAYMTSYFNAWINNHNLGGEKRLVTGFQPWTLVEPASVENFFSAYPDGFMISLLREPKSWYASMKGYYQRAGQQADIDRDVGDWLGSAKAMARNKTSRPERVLVLRFEDLVGRLEPVMQRLCEFTGLAFHPCLLEPTFNGAPIDPNTSLSTSGGGVMKDPLDRARSLEPGEAEAVDALAARAYGEALAVAEKIGE